MPELQLLLGGLARVPSIIYGLLGLQVFSRYLGLGGNLLSGALTLSLLILQTIWYQILPAASGGIMTGIILAISRALGEAAHQLIFRYLVL